VHLEYVCALRVAFRHFPKQEIAEADDRRKVIMKRVQERIVPVDLVGRGRLGH
jgi:hypothetical protein